MNKPSIYHWIFGIAVFAGVVGFWAWQLPATLSRESMRADTGLARIFSSFQNGAKPTSESLSEIREGFDRGMANLNAAASESSGAAAVETMKNRIEVEAKLKAALSAQAGAAEEPQGPALSPATEKTTKKK